MQINAAGSPQAPFPLSLSTSRWRRPSGDEGPVTVSEAMLQHMLLAAQCMLLAAQYMLLAVNAAGSPQAPFPLSPSAS